MNVTTEFNVTNPSWLNNTEALFTFHRIHNDSTYLYLVNATGVYSLLVTTTTLDGLFSSDGFRFETVDNKSSIGGLITVHKIMEIQKKVGGRFNAITYVNRDPPHMFFYGANKRIMYMTNDQEVK